MNMCLTFCFAILCDSKYLEGGLWNVWGASLIRWQIQNTSVCCEWKFAACISFSIWEWVVQKWEVKKERGEPGKRSLASHCRHVGSAQTLASGISGGHVFETEWPHQPNTVCCLMHSHIYSHTPSLHTHSQHKAKSQPALSAHLLLPNISIMKCTVTYASSDSAGLKMKSLLAIWIVRHPREQDRRIRENKNENTVKS